jgi:hypothetical protein
MIRAVKTRRLGAIVAATTAALAIALPSTAGAFVDHFSVISQDIQNHQTHSAFVFRSVLLNPANPANRVGRGHGKCKFTRGDRKSHCLVLLHFDGTIGGFGNLALRGNLGRGDHTLNVVDGDGDFSGAISGKAFVHNLNKPTNLVDIALIR